ncbi:TPA: hypothetical protein N0F65_003800 [Lagenidium giganteum]|uniref:DNA helicase Pif1-like 2B domain-containing protein n=1 Tax=Lagenidium giganteum TaxID=4803 RepID=A0AAV2Z1X6_9STRA|nr:TPA: hypothetical protein N0F65_003800 [Lagenidium giganteum]
MLAMIPGEVVELQSVDSLIAKDRDSFGAWCPVEFLHAVSPSGMPKHVLRLKVGMPVLLVRNRSPLFGLCNGTRMIVRETSRCVVNCVIASVSISRIKRQPGDASFPFQFQRIPFPLAFAFPINKAQGQTRKHVGIFLPEPVLAHGQLYVALSRVGSETPEPALSTQRTSFIQRRCFLPIATLKDHRHTAHLSLLLQDGSFAEDHCPNIRVNADARRSGSDRNRRCGVSVDTRRVHVNKDPLTIRIQVVTALLSDLDKESNCGRRHRSAACPWFARLQPQIRS